MNHWVSERKHLESQGYGLSTNEAQQACRDSSTKCHESIICRCQQSLLRGTSGGKEIS